MKDYIIRKIKSKYNDKYKYEYYDKEIIQLILKSSNSACKDYIYHPLTMMYKLI